MPSTGRRTKAESPPAVLCTVGSVPPEIKSRVTDTRYPRVGTSTVQRGKRGHGSSMDSAHRTNTARLAQ